MAAIFKKAAILAHINKFTKLEFHMKSWPNVKLGNVAVGLNIVQNHSSSL